MRFWGWVCLVLSFVAVGCGRSPDVNSSGVATFLVPKLDSDREEFLHRFPLLNDAEEMSAPRDPQTGKAPFGVLIHMPKLGEGMFCSVAHVSPGRVTANAHCIKKDSSPSEYFLVFYNKRNWKRFERIQAFVYIGDAESDDIAVLQVSQSVARNWDTIEGRVVRSQREIDQPVAQSHQVTLWSFNPFGGNHPELEQKYQGPGMRFMPKHCNASRTKPSVTGLAIDEMGVTVNKVKINHSKPQSQMHWFVDACDNRPVKGNSGSLITLRDDISRVVGAYHWNIPQSPEYRGQFNRFEYTGNDGALTVLGWEDFEKRDMFGVAIDFEYILGQHPRIF